MKVTELVSDWIEMDGADVEVSRLAYDSRDVEPGALFAALVGSRSDGHDHVASAVARGAVAVLCERAVECEPATRIEVEDTRRALAIAAKRIFADPSASLTMVGITGTNGKTTTAHLVEGVLTAAGRAVGVIGTLGAHFVDGAGARTDVAGTLTTPQSVELIALLATMRDAGTTAVAMEVSSHALDQERALGVDYDVGVFTNLSHDHLDYHGTLDAYFDAKARLVSERLKDAGAAVLNLDDERVATLMEGAGVEVVGFTAANAPGSRVSVRASRSDRAGVELEVRCDAATMQVRSSLVGAFNIENILAAVSVGVALGIDHDVIAQGIAAVRSVPGRLERVSDPGQPLVLVDYAHTPDALRKALATVRAVTTARVICVFGCGGDRDADKRAPMGEAAAAGADLAILTNDNPRSEDPRAIAAAVEQGLGAAHYQVELDRGRAIEVAIRSAGSADSVLIAGKGHEDYQIIGDQRLDFDDRVVARAILGHIGGDA